MMSNIHSQNNVLTLDTGRDTFTCMVKHYGGCDILPR